MAEDPATAYDLALERIARARRKGLAELDLSRPGFAALDRMPDEIGELAGLTTLNLGGTAISDLSALAGLSALTDLRLEGTPVEQLDPLRGLLGLETLFLSRTRVRSLAPLQDLRKLVHLDVEGTGVERVAVLHRMDRLERLTLANTKVSDITPLNGATGLRHLWLDGTNVSHIYPLEGLRRLRLLSLARTPVEDLMALRSLENLETLDINDTQVSDLGPLMGLPRLSQLWFEGAEVLDLRPLLDLPLTRPGAGIWFARTPAVRSAPELARLARKDDRESRTRDTLTFLRTLPVWPDPLPRDMRAVPWETDANGDPVFPRLGTILNDRRLELGRTTEEVRESTGIPAVDIAAVESTPLSNFTDPEAVSVDLRQYARHLDLDPDWALEWFWIEARGSPGALDAAGSRGPPRQARAPLEVIVENGRLTQTRRPSGLGDDAATRAEAGWRALRDYLDDLNRASERLGNAMPRLAAALGRLDAALGVEFGALNAVAAGIHGSRVARLATEAPEMLMEADAADLAEFAGQITGLLERFPDWQAYREDVRADPVPEAMDEVLPEIREITEALEDREEVAPDIAEALDAQIETVEEDPADERSRTGLALSLRNVLSALAIAALQAAETAARETGDIAARTWDAAKKTTATGISAAALDIVLAKGAAMQALARTLPEQFGWLEPVLRTVGL